MRTPAEPQGACQVSRNQRVGILRTLQAHLTNRLKALLPNQPQPTAGTAGDRASPNRGQAETKKGSNRASGGQEILTPLTLSHGCEPPPMDLQFLLEGQFQIHLVNLAAPCPHLLDQKLRQTH
jgi:hypothetical protein